MTPVWLNRGADGYEQVGDYVSMRTKGRTGAYRDYTAMGVANASNTIIAVMLFHDYDADAGIIQISGASEDPRWLTRPVLREMFAFPFDEIGCQAVVMRVDPDDKRLDRILKAYGFQRFDLPRIRGRDKGEAIFLLFDDVWRSSKFNRERLH